MFFRKCKIVFYLATGASSNPCSDTFAGPRAWSEPETEQLATYLSTLASRVNIYLSFHSYGQYMLFPYGHTGEHVENYEELVGEHFTALKIFFQNKLSFYEVCHCEQNCRSNCRS